MEGKCDVKYWRTVFRPYFVYDHYVEVDIVQLFTNTISQNEKMIKELLSTL